MRKGFAGGAIALVTVALAAPFGFSFLAQARLQELIEEVNAGGAVRADLVTFQRGWLQSRADVAVEVIGDAANGYMEFQRKAGRDPEPLRCTLRSAVHHGPVPLGAGDPAPAVAVLIGKLTEGEGCRQLQEKLGLTLTTRFDLGGGGRIQAAIPEHNFADQEKGTLNWQGLDLQVQFERGFRSVATAMDAPGLVVTGRQADLRMGALALASDIHKGIADLGLGEFSLTLASLAVQPKTEGAVLTRIDGIVVEGASRDAGDGTVDAEVLLRAGDIAVGDLELGEATYKVALRNLDAHALAKINQTVVDLRQKNLPPEQMNMMLGATVLGLLPDLLKRGPVLEISEISMGSDGARLLAKGRLSVDTSDPTVLQNPLLLKDALLLEAQVDLPEPLLVAFTEFGLRKQLAAMDAEYSDEQIVSMAQIGVRQRMAQQNMQRLFLLEDGVYRMRMHMADGRFNLNGQTVDPSALMPQQP